MLKGALKDGQIVTNEWQALRRNIDGVVAREVLHVPRDHGVITEMYRPEWDPTGPAGRPHLPVAPLPRRDRRVELPREDRSTACS